jgi:hypothetical protein
MKYIVRKLSDDFIFDELEQVRKNFVSSLSYTLESAEVFFNKDAADPLDIFIRYDFEEKKVIHGFNLSEEIARNFQLDVNEYHASESLLVISEKLKALAQEGGSHSLRRITMRLMRATFLAQKSCVITSGCYSVHVP